MNIKIEEKAKQSLDLMKIKYPKDLPKVINAIKDLKNNWINVSSIKNIWDWVYRKRVWRWRILFSYWNNEIIIWIIKIEKDTKKDYKVWKTYIISRIN